MAQFIPPTPSASVCPHYLLPLLTMVQSICCTLTLIKYGDLYYIIFSTLIKLTLTKGILLCLSSHLIQPLHALWHWRCYVLTFSDCAISKHVCYICVLWSTPFVTFPVVVHSAYPIYSPCHLQLFVVPHQNFVIHLLPRLIVLLYQVNTIIGDLRSQQSISLAGAQGMWPSSIYWTEALLKM